MIYVQVHGRLGNQMFQYAFARWLQLNIDEPIVMNFSKVSSRENDGNGWCDDLKNFNVCDYISVLDKEHFLISKSTISQKLILILYVFSQKICGIIFPNKLQKIREKSQKKLNVNGIYWIINGYYDPEISSSKNIIINGHFENAAFYRCMKLVLQKEFTPVYPPLDANRNIYEQIDYCESVCISIRRGDFLSAENSDIYYICNEEYFYKAVEKINSMVINPRFFIFSDDPKWVKDNMHFPEDSVYENEGNPVWEKLRLMYSCKHFIISNSTFSWWAQYLSRNENKVVISPDRWKNNSNYKGLIADDFITIEV